MLLFIAFAWRFVEPGQPAPVHPRVDQGHRSASTGGRGSFRAQPWCSSRYIGFDAVSTAAQEAKNPQKDMPIGILGSLAVCTLLYIAVSTDPDRRRALPAALGPSSHGGRHRGQPGSAGSRLRSRWRHRRPVVSHAGHAPRPTRIFFSMAHDGLFPPVAAKNPSALRHATHHDHRSPASSAPSPAGILPIDILGELTSIGTFVRIRAGQHRRPDPTPQAAGHPARAFKSAWRPVHQYPSAALSPRASACTQPPPRR